MTLLFRTLLLCFAGFAIGRILIFPGFIDPGTPSHDDLYRYYLIGQSQWQPQMWLSPRPLMLAFLHVVGGFMQDARVFWAVLSTTSIFFVAVVIHVLRILRVVEPSRFSIFLFSAALFSLPSSWGLYQLDFGGMLSGILSAAAIYTLLDRKRQSSTSAPVLPLALFWLAIETKPTFGAVILFLSIINALIARDKNSFLLVIGVVLVSAIVVAKDAYLGSPFLNVADTGQIYSVRLGVSANLEALLTFIRAAVPTHLMPGLVICYYILWKQHARLMLIALLPSIGVMAVVPMALIPNRIIEHYSWYAAIFFLAPLLSISINDGRDVPRYDFHIKLLAIGLLVAGMALGSYGSRPYSSHYRSISEFNSRVLDSLLLIRNDSHHWSTSKVLIAGMKGSFHPFRHKAFVQTYAQLSNHTVLLRSSENSWNKMSTGMGDSVNLSRVEYLTFDQVFVFGAEGVLHKIYSHDDVVKIPPWWRDAVFFCAADPEIERIGYREFEAVMACFNYADESKALIQLVERNNFGFQLAPIGYFYLGNAYKALRDFASATASFEKALASGENNHFREALNSVKLGAPNAAGQ